jgi:two-component system chemotaxis response regulator CheY
MFKAETSREDRRRVLVVDDDPGMRLVCATTLELDGFDVIEAANGQEGLELAFSGEPDLVLLDIRMPVLDGFGLAAALRADVRTRSLPLVFITGETGPQISTRVSQTGAVGLFSKPFDPAAVNALIDQVLVAR